MLVDFPTIPNGVICPIKNFADDLISNPDEFIVPDGNLDDCLFTTPDRDSEPPTD